MPLHLSSVTGNDDYRNPFIWMTTVDFQENVSETLASEDKKYMHLISKIYDKKANALLGCNIYTIFVNNQENRLEFLDADVFFKGGKPLKLKFEERLDESSDANEYYQVNIENEDGRAFIETVNRHGVHEKIEGTTREVYVCAFPFDVKIFDTLEELNKFVGFKDGIKVGDTDIVVQGLGEKFISPSVVSEKNEIYSTFIGKIQEYQECKVQFDKEYDFILAKVDTAFGVIPMPLNKNYFDLSKLRTGSYILASADVKVNFFDLKEEKIV